jgi:hypothetical protein
MEGTAVPEAVARLADVMGSYPRPWALCGGWALDAWLGRVSRDHGDVDLSVFDADHGDLFDHLAGWQLIAHTSAADDASTGLWDGRRLPVPSHIHARSPADAGLAPIPEDGVCEPAKGWWLDIQIDAGDDAECVLSDTPRVALPVRDAIRLSPWGVPATSPEVLLFFKAGCRNRAYPRRRDWRDFVMFLPRLSDEQAAWLRGAIARVDPGNPWIEPLSWVPAIRRARSSDH